MIILKSVFRLSIIFLLTVFFPITEVLAQQNDLIEGYPFTRYFQNGEDFTGTDFAYGIIEADNGTILFGNDNIGAQLINGTSSFQIPYPRSSVAAYFAKDKTGKIYSSGNAVFGYLKHHHVKGFQFHSLTHLTTDSTVSIPFLHKITPVGDAGDMVFIGLERGYVYHPERNSVTTLTPDGTFFDAEQIGGKTWITDSKSGLQILQTNGAMNSISTPFSAGDHRLLNLNGKTGVYTSNNDLWIYDESNQFWQKSAHFNYYNDKPKYHILSASTLSDGRIVLTTLSGVQIFNTNGTLLHDFNSSNILPTDVAGMAYESTNGTLWVSSPVGLISIELSNPQRRFLTSQGLPDKRIRVAGEWENNLFVGTESGLWKSNGNRFSSLLSETAVFDLHKSPFGMLVASSRGLLLLDEDNNERQLTDELFVQFIYPDPAHPNTFYFYDSPNNISRIVFSETGDILDLRSLFQTSLTPFTLSKVSDEEIWFGTANFGVYQLYTESDEYGISGVIDHNIWNEEDGFPAETQNQVFTLEGDVAFNTQNGFYKLTHSRDSVIPNPRFSYTETEMSNQHLWPFETIKKTNSSTEEFVGNLSATVFPYLFWDDSAETYSRENLPLPRTTEFKNPSKIHYGNSGRIYTVSSESVSYLNLDRFKNQKHPSFKPRIQLTGVTAQADSVLFSGWTQTSPTSQSIDHDWNSLRFNWGLIAFEPTLNNRYQFRLLGTGEEWSDWTEENFADYRNLREGTYEFQVRGRNMYHEISDIASYPFSVRPPWFRSMWAYGFYLILIGLVTAGTFRWRTQQLLRRQQELEKEVEERTSEIQHKNEQLEQLNQVKTRFFSNISHEFRTPLTLIKGPALRLKNTEFSLSKSGISESANLIIDNANRLLTMVEEVLNLSKMESGTFRLEIQRINLSELVERVAAWYRPLAAEKNLELITSISPNISEKQVLVDVRQIELMISNLISNGVKYTVKGEILIGLKADTSGSAQFIVQDTGTGIAQEDLPNIFTRYYRSPSVMLSRSGSGIGLNLVQFIANLHGISLDIESKIGSGTTITAVIPGTESALSGEYILLEDDESITNNHQETATSSNFETGLTSSTQVNPDLAKPTTDQDIPVVLIVDDNAGIRLFIKQTLSDQFQFAECSNGLDGIELAKEILPDIILSDVMMPGMDGYSFTKELKKDNATRHIPVLLITAKGGEYNELTGLEAGANDYISKPFSPNILKARIQGQLALQRQLRTYLAEQFKQQSEVSSEDQLGKSLSADKEEEKQSDFLKQVEETIKMNIANPDFSVELLAAELNTSKSSLYRKLKKLTDLSAQEMIKKQRLNLAKELIQNDERTVSEIAYAVGYNSISYFSRAFREQFGLSPSELSS